MPRPPQPRRLRTDNIKRVLSRDVVDGLTRALTPLRGKTGHWTERDPEALEAWWRAVLLDPRAQPSREDRLPKNHSQRLDCCPSDLVTMKCRNCNAQATYTLADLIASFGPDQNIRALPVLLLPCKNKRERRDGQCDIPAGARRLSRERPQRR